MVLMPVSDAIDRILDGVCQLDAEHVPVTEASGRTLATAVQARLTQPPFDASAMDGYAVRADDIATAPAILKLVGVSAAGNAFSGAVQRGEAVRIFTGAPVPEGADTVVIQENTRPLSPDSVEIVETAAPGRNIRLRGYDFREGDTLLQPGRRLSSRHIMLAASMNHGTLAVTRRPMAAILATGDELVTPGETPDKDQIISSVPAGLKAAIEIWGGSARILDIARDTPDHLEQCIARGRGSDILVTIGGASVGDHDFVRAVLEKAGAKFQVMKVALRPGKPLMFGTLDNQRVMSLPGNPVSALICASLFLQPLLCKMLGLPTAITLIDRPLGAPLPANGEREHYMRAKVTGDGVLPLSDQDSSLTSAFAEADCLIKRPATAPAAERGQLVPTFSLDF